MSNREKYKQAFNAIYTSESLDLEVITMKKTENNKLKKILSTAAACIIIIGGASVAYAKDVGGIKRTVQLWMHGDQTNATIEFGANGTYNMEYEDESGKLKNRGGGGVAFNDDGTERPLTEEELMEQLYAPEVEYLADGSIWVYWFDQKLEITDKFKKDICFVKLVNDKDTIYMTVKYQNGYAISHEKFIQPWEFN